ncbi:MAG: AraC family transcriptional regulator [Bacteroidota bacterium]|nr:AraC family transcriptional regulator [Bacteroidota bacterium]
MPIYLNNNFESKIEFGDRLPVSYSGPLLKGSNVLYFAKDTCQLIIQEIITDLYTLRLNVFRFLETVTLRSVSQKEGIHSRILLKGNLHHRIKGAGRINLREGEFTMFWADSANCKCRFEENVEYRTLDIFYGPQLIQQLIPFFPELKYLDRDEHPKQLVKNPCFITPLMSDITRQIMECPFDESTSQFYFELKVREYLFLMLEHIYRRPPSRYRFTPYETACIIKAHQLLLEDVSKKPLSLRMLAKAVAINEFKLKAGFRQLFGMSIFDCLHEARMQKARELLLSTNDPIKQICELTGYPRMTNFITAFRRRFGYTPGSIRRK